QVLESSHSKQQQTQEELEQLRSQLQDKPQELTNHPVQVSPVPASPPAPVAVAAIEWETF
ncbi:hypothetical protein, partial [Limnospira fusiformis]|uniref:hypothetical protein n=1 Tax=Limnospira fusiformis TaxID=54297 RepID=UPI002AA23750|nr:hypothetical protein [Limnospira fusiformis LS22]